MTIFLSNDATAVVLTPAVYAAARRAGAPPLPYLLVCAFIANAASFVLPISNPANLVVFGSQMPVLRSWIAEFGIASVVSIVTTYAILYLTQRKLLSGRIATRVSQPSLTGSARIVAGAIWVAAIALLIASTLGWQLGFPTFLAGVGAWIGVSVIKREAPWRVLGKVSWSVLPLVAGLFVLVAGVEQTGVLKSLTEFLSSSARQSPHETALLAGTAVAFACNAINNLPMGLLASTVAQSAQLPAQVTGAVLIGVDLGPNLSVTGSLATILWLVAIRREGEDVSAWKFLAVGSLVMPLPLLASLASFIGLAVINRF